jgi:hypothetical protein
MRHLALACAFLVVSVAAVLLTPAASGQEEYHFDDHAHAAHDYDHPGPRGRELLLSFYARSLGVFYTVVLLFSGIVAFALALLVVIRGGDYAGPALLFIVPLPLFIGVYASLGGLIDSFTIMAMSASPPKPAEIAGGYATALVAPRVAMWCMTPAFLTALIGLIVRVFLDRPGAMKP